MEGIVVVAVLWPVVLVLIALLLVRWMRRSDLSDERRRRAVIPAPAEPSPLPSPVPGSAVGPDAAGPTGRPADAHTH